MLNLQGLTNDIVSAFNDILPGAFEQALLQTFPEKSEAGAEIAKEFGETISNLISKPLGSRIASAIDYYIKTGSLKGTIITAGSPFTQTAVISPVNMGNPVAGAVPNTLGIV